MRNIAPVLLLFFVGIVTAQAQTTTSVTSTGFTATWSALSGATAYEIDVYQKQSVTPLNVTEGFDSGAVPATWSSNTTETYAAAGNYGAAAPSMALKQVGKYIAIPTQEQFINHLQFWCKGQGADSKSAIIFSIEYAGRWIELDSIKPLPADGGTWGGAINTQGITAFKLTYSKSAGNVAIDDVNFKTDGVKRTYASGYKAKNVGNVLSCNVSGLTAGATYYFVVRGVNGSTVVAPNGSEVSVTLPAAPVPVDTCSHSYYGNICDYKQLSGAALKTKLQEKVKGHTVIAYGGVDEKFDKTDEKSNGKIWNIYSNYEFNTNQNDCGNNCPATAEGAYYNKEHSFPRSWFCTNSDTKNPSALNSDIHHIFPTDKFINGKRSNYPYGEVVGTTTISSNGAKLGTCSVSGYSGQVFEPASEYKGDLARALFYVVTRYESEVVGWKNCSSQQNILDGTTYPAIKKWQLDMLLKWHKQDPVSQKEIDRNNAIFGIQKNRNPFVDFPELVEKIWGTSSSTTAIQSEKTEAVKVYPNPVQSALSVELPIGAAMEYSIYNIGGVLQQKGVTQGVVDVSGLTNGTYFIVLGGKTIKYSAQFVKWD